MSTWMIFRTIFWQQYYSGSPTTVMLLTTSHSGHDLVPFPGELCPAGARLRVLLQPSQPLPVKLEIDLAQLGSTGPSRPEYLPLSSATVLAFSTRAWRHTEIRVSSKLAVIVTRSQANY